MAFGGITDPYKDKRIQPMNIWLRFFNHFSDLSGCMTCKTRASMLAHAETSIFGLGIPR